MRPYAIDGGELNSTIAQAANMQRFGGKKGRGWDQLRNCYLLKSKHRVMGIDTEALDSQVDSHKAARDAARKEGLATAKHWAQINSMLSEEEIREQAESMKCSQQLVNDWHFQRRPSDRIEADLNPKINRTNPINPDTCGVSAAQRFNGEDVSLKERNRIQASQVRSWCDMELREKQEAIAREKEAERSQCAIDRQIDAMRLESERAAQISAQEQLHDVCLHNQLLAKEKRAEMRIQNLMDKKANQWEVDGAYQSAVLSEYNYGRGRRDHYKGMNQNEIDDIHRFNANQLAELQENRKGEKDEDMYWAQNNQEVNTILCEAEQQEENVKTAARYELNSDHLAQRHEHKQREKYLKRELGEGGVNNGFYSQFGSDCTTLAAELIRKDRGNISGGY